MSSPRKALPKPFKVGMLTTLAVLGGVCVITTLSTMDENVRNHWIKQAPQYSQYITNNESFNVCLIDMGNRLSLVRPDYVKTANEACRLDPQFKSVR